MATDGPNCSNEQLNSLKTSESIEHAIQRIDAESLGEAAVSLIKDLFPICRSITGGGLRETLEIIGKHVDLNVHEVPTGYQAYDWVVPKEWNIRDAYVKNSLGERVIDFRNSNLHVLNYSAPISATMTLSELKPHLYSLPDQPTAIPYRTSYYEERWGFCLSHNQLMELQEDVYEVFIDSTLENGFLTYADAVLPGTSDKELVFSMYVCHPSLANHELSGPALATMLYQLLKSCQRTWTYRFIFVPETIGALVYLSKHGEHLRNHMRAGYVVASVGRSAPFGYKRSRRGTTPADRVAEHCLQHPPSAIESQIMDFAPYGSDERQYCSPGFDLPVGLLTRPMYGTFPEYHTSLDNLEFVSAEAMGEVLKMCLRIVQAHELNRKYLNLAPHGEPQLSKRGLYPTIGAYGSGEERASTVERKMYLLGFGDGEHDLIDIANKARRPVWEFVPELQELLEANLLGLSE